MFFTLNTKKLIAQKIRGIWNPELYHGWGKKKRFFEGWYYKIVSKDEKSACAFIPGVAMNQNGNKQAFIQVLDGKKSTSEYIKFPFESFKANPKKHTIEINKNRFTTHSVDLDLPNIKELDNGQKIIVGIRPEYLIPSKNGIPAKIAVVEPVSYTHLTLPTKA